MERTCVPFKFDLGTAIDNFINFGEGSTGRFESFEEKGGKNLPRSKSRYRVKNRVERRSFARMERVRLEFGRVSCVPNFEEPRVRHTHTHTHTGANYDSSRFSPGLQ